MEKGSASHLFVLPPWTGSSQNALGTLWSIEYASAYQGHIILRNSFKNVIATTQASVQATYAHHFAAMVMDVCDRARQVVSRDNRVSWDYTVVEEIPRIYRAADHLISLIAELNKQPETQGVLSSWWRDLTHEQHLGLWRLRKDKETAAAIDQAAETLNTIFRNKPGERFVYKIVDNFRAQVATKSFQGLPLIVPVPAIGSKIVASLKNATVALKQLRKDSSPERNAAYAAWGGVIIPSMNAFCDVIEKRLGVPEDFPTIVETLIGMREDILDLSSRLVDVPCGHSAALADLSANISTTESAFARKLDGNLELLALDKEQRREVYRGFGSPARKEKHPSAPVLSPRKVKGDQLTLDISRKRA